MNRIWKLAVPTIVLLAAAAVPAVPALPAAPQPIALAKPCICPDVYAPVCGVNGVTYENSCRARCAGVAIAHSGPCGTES